MSESKDPRNDMDRRIDMERALLNPYEMPIIAMEDSEFMVGEAMKTLDKMENTHKLAGVDMLSTFIAAQNLVGSSPEVIVMASYFVAAVNRARHWKNMYETLAKSVESKAEGE